jgi:histidinol-phosphate aminotransferase
MSLCQRIGRVNSRRSSSGFNFLRINGRVTGSCETNDEKGNPKALSPRRVRQDRSSFFNQIVYPASSSMLNLGNPFYGGALMMASRREFLRFGAGIASVAFPLSSNVLTLKEAPASLVDEENAPILLYSNENAYGASLKVMETIRAGISGSNRYPRLRYRELKERIAAYHKVAADRVLLGCGSTEILRMAACAFLGKGMQLIHASPTFEAIEHYARTIDSQIVGVPLTRSFAHDLERMLATVTPSTTLVYICNPNNPTASLTPRKDLETFITKVPASTVVIVDEAYHHYAGSSAMYASFIDHPMHDDKVIVARTFSKVYGLAGLRLGYAVGSPKILERMNKFGTEDNINGVVTQAAFVALGDSEGVNNFIEHNANDRQEFFNQAMARALKPIDSHTNFVMMDTFHQADEIIEQFRKHNIVIGRHFPPMDTYIRVSLGLPDEMQAFWRTWDLLPYPRNAMHH